MSEEVWNGFPERRKSERRSLDAALVPAAFLVQLAASHAGIGPFAKRNLETPAAAADLDPEKVLTIIRIRSYSCFRNRSNFILIIRNFLLIARPVLFTSFI